MKPYWAFYWDRHYPQGGMNDFIDVYDTLDEAIDAIRTRHRETFPDDTTWQNAIGEVFDSEIGDFVYYAFPDRIQPND